MRNDVWNFFLIVVYHCCNIPERKHFSCVKHGIVVLRPCFRYLVAKHDIRDLGEVDEQQLRQTMLAQKEYTLLMERGYRMEKEDVYRKRQDLYRAGEVKCLFCICRKGIRPANSLGSECRACYLICTECSGFNLYTTSI